MVGAVNQSLDQWEILSMSEDLHRHHPAPHLLDFPDVTLFEKLFIQDRLPIHEIKLKVRLYVLPFEEPESESSTFGK
jgi:hypothetical protein